MPSRKITKTTIDGAKSGERDYFIWDSDLSGFGLKVSKSGRKSYVCQYRTGGGRAGASRRMTIGVHGSPWTVDQARTEARKLLGRAANGEDPASQKQGIKKLITVSQLCDMYLADGGIVTLTLRTRTGICGSLSRWTKSALSATDFHRTSFAMPFGSMPASL